MKKTNILILYSLPSPFLPNGTHDPVGQESVLARLQAVQEALLFLGHRVQTLESAGDLLPLVENILAARPDLIFNLCEEYHSQTQLEMHIAALLELLAIPFTGSSSLVLGLSQDKGKTKSILAHYGIPTPAYQVWTREENKLSPDLHFPFVVKPLGEDASLGIDNDAYVQDEKSLRRQVQKIHQLHGQPALVEEYIDGRELNVSILGNTALQVLPISEIDFSTLPAKIPRICSYAAKWMEGSQEFIHTVPFCPAVLSLEIEKKVLEVSLQSYRITGCRDYGRVDIRLSLEGIPYVLEINANPDISPDAGMTRSAKVAGYAYPDFIGRIAELAWARRATSRPRSKTNKKF